MLASLLAKYLLVPASSFAVLSCIVPGWRYKLSVAAAGVASTSFCFLVVWNPTVRQLLMDGDDTRSGAATTCKFHEPSASEFWKRLNDSPKKVDAGSYYAEYHSHPIRELASVRQILKHAGCQRFIYLAGDSTLDNKHWFFNGFARKKDQMHDPSFTGPAVNGYQDALVPPRMVRDVSYWLNAAAEERLGPAKLCTLMTSVEESTLYDRQRWGLLAQDAFIRDHIGPEDYLIVSVGGNDIALNPRVRTVFNMFMLTRCPDALIRSGLAPGFGFFVRFFHGEVQKFVRQLVAKDKPKRILICTLYYLDEKPGGSWADHVLQSLGYDANPAKLQLIISTLFDHVQRRGFDIPGVDSVDVIPFPLFRVLDGKNSSDYAQRVEPSVSGGRKMADAMLEALL